MERHISPEHPKCSLYFFIYGPLRHEVAEAFERLLGSIAERRRWVVDAPQLIDRIDEYPGRAPEEQVIHTFGGVLQMYSALPPWGQRLPKELDGLHYEEVALIVEELCGLSREWDCQFVLKLDDAHVGFIRSGIPDRSIQLGLLEEWRAALDLRNG
ncbi:MAG: hypothetical protein NTY19_23700 [Planctomycetota bacterium]|nr:hypothetical protein [Planctomycetota bacterium]